MQRAGSFLAALQPEMAKALPRHLNPERLARIALTEVRRTPLLAECTTASLGGALMTCAQLGLEPGVGGEAYLLPFKNSRENTYEVQLIIGYQGMAKLFWQSPLAKSLDAQAVFPEDEFEYEYGLTPKLRHVPSLDRPSSSQAKCYYAVATTTSGGSAFVVLSRADVERFRKRGRGGDRGPWVSDYDAMAKKTCIRQLFKLIPKQAELALAVANDETVRIDYRNDLAAITPVHVSEIDPAETDIIDPPAAGGAVDEPEGREVRRTLEEAWAADRADAEQDPGDE